MYTKEVIRKLIEPLAQRYDIAAVYLFGSYARGDATESSDVDIIIDTEGSNVKGLFELGGFYNEMEQIFGSCFDMITYDCLTSIINKRRNPLFIEHINREKELIYAKQN